MRKGILKNRGVWQYAPTLIIFLFLSACTQKVCDVGDITINNKDISLRKKVSDIYYPNSGKDYAALAQLIKGYLSEEALKSIGYKVDNTVLEAEAKRIDENTKAPDTLKKIKDIYGRNRDAYIKTFVRIVYAERFLYNEVFLKSEDIHREQYLKAEGLIKKAKKAPNSFQAISKDMGLEPKRLKISLKEGIMPYEKTGSKQMHEAIGIGQAERLIKAVTKIRQGDVYPDIIEWPEMYQAIRYIKKEKNPPSPPFSKGGKGGLENNESYYIIDSVSIPKRSYDDWFWEKAGKIPVRIYDKGLKDEFLKNVSWSKRVKTL